MRTSDLPPYDDREIAFLRGEPMPSDDLDDYFYEDGSSLGDMRRRTHGYDCDCQSCQDCEEYEKDEDEGYVFVYEARPDWMVALEVAAIAVAAGFLSGLMLGVLLR